MAAIAATALPDCLWAEGRTLLPSRWWSKTIIIIIACDNKKIIIGLRNPLSGRHFWDAPRGAARAAQEALGWISRPQGGIPTPRIPAQGGAGGFLGCPQGGSTGSAGSLGGGSADRREADLPQGFLRRVGQGVTLRKWNPNFAS